ncbi:hypothetical protein IFM89_021886 [Coptis chinensis]|uniref:PI4-kinase N-terminal domain-containing protein n=1 Tax=Coptis chinensis TaxID=261450 RepID=A0A835HER2_9MAGN|nr:hypothetical protein IFM89_021886 [Coptis chinensis]
MNSTMGEVSSHSTGLHQLDIEMRRIVLEWKFEKDRTDITMSDITNNSKGSQLDPSASIFLGLDDNRIFKTFYNNRNQKNLSIAAYSSSPSANESLPFVIGGNKVILSASNPETKVDNAEFEENEAYAVDIVTSTGDGKVVSSVKWLEDELELNALHSPGSRRGSGNEKAALVQSSLCSFRSNGGILNGDMEFTASRSAFSHLFEYLKTPNLLPTVLQGLIAIIHRSFEAAM